jgi:hypothetical protein
MTATTEPARVTAGDTIAWLKSLPDYPASAGWVLTYTLINQTTKYTLAASASGDDHLVSVSAATSAGWTSGLYTWSATVAKGSERQTVAGGLLTVAADLASATTFDARTSTRKALDAVNLALETYGNKAYLQAYEINGRSQKFHTPGDFLAFRSRLAAEVAGEIASERLAAGLSARKQIFVRFGPR